MARRPTFAILEQLLILKLFGAGEVTTSFLSTFAVSRAAFEVLESGTQTTIQDYLRPAELLARRCTAIWPNGFTCTLELANRLVGNSDGVSGSGDDWHWREASS